jgi:hypothetical protein
MKIAIFFSGRVKSYEDKYDLMEFIKSNNIDGFCALNDTKIDENFCKLFNIKSYYFAPYKDQLEKDFSEENLKKLEKNRIHKETNFFNVLSMLFHHKKNMELIKEYEKNNGFVYDIIIYVRADIINHDKFPTLQKPDKNIIFIPKGNDWRGGINDQFAYGDHFAMEIYCNLYDNICKYIDDGVIYHPETIVRYNLNKNNVTINRFDFNYSIDAKRLT